MWRKTRRFPEILLPFQTRTHLCTRSIESTENAETVGLYLACHSRCLPEHFQRFIYFAMCISFPSSPHLYSFQCLEISIWDFNLFNFCYICD